MELKQLFIILTISLLSISSLNAFITSSGPCIMATTIGSSKVIKNDGKNCILSYISGKGTYKKDSIKVKCRTELVEGNKYKTVYNYPITGLCQQGNFKVGSRYYKIIN